jgi:hypothetical protein
MRRAFILLAALAACSADDPTFTDVVDAPPAEIDAGDYDGPSVDAGDPDGGPAPGFGMISGQCGVLTPTELDGTTPLWFQRRLLLQTSATTTRSSATAAHAGRPVHRLHAQRRRQLGAVSEVFAFEWLARCEAATLIKTETEIVYDVVGKKADILVEIDERKVGVSASPAR